ncbi:MAG: hypothetical protein ABI577_10215 [bacterium]
MSGTTGRETWRRPLLRFASYVVVTYLGILALIAVGLWARGSWSTHAFALAFYLAGGMVAAGYVLVMLGINSSAGTPGLTPPSYAYFPLDRDAIGGPQRADEMQELAPLVFALLALFWAPAVLLDMFG